MRATLAIAFALMFPLHVVFAQTNSPIVKRELRGVWISTVTNIDWPTAPGLPAQTQKDQLIAILDKVKAAGFNAVVFQIRPECDAYYSSPYEPWSYWLTGQQGTPPSPYYDPLQFAVEEAHKRGLELHAWFNPYRAVRDTLGAYPPAPNHVTVQHPDWVIKISRTKILDPGKQVVRNYVSGVFADVVRRYDIDATHIDDYFYVEGISTQDANTFATEPRGFTNLGDWRRDNVNLLIKQIYDSVRTIKPWVKWGVSPRGIYRNGVPPGITGNDNYSSIYTDSKKWYDSLWLDYMAPQLYWRIGGPQDYTLLQPWWSSVRNGRHLYPGLATYRIGDANFGSASMIAQQLRFNRTTDNAQGAIQFTANNITGNRGGITDSLTQDLFRYPSLVPPMRWKDSIAPNPVRNIRYARMPNGGSAAFQWDLPITAADGDSAYRYVLYRFDLPIVSPTDLDSVKNIRAIEGRRFSKPAAPPTQGPWYFVVTSLDRNYNEGSMSNVVTVNPPVAPVLAYPANGAQNQPPTMTLGWNGAAAAGTYHLQIAADPSFTSGMFLSDSSIVDTFKVLTGTAGQQTYYWRLRSINAGGWSSFGSAFNFRTGFPVAPLLASPANYSTSVNPAGARLEWRPAGGAQTYRIQFSQTFDFSTVIKDTSGVVDTTIVLPPLTQSTIYFWRINATNTLGTSAWSDIWRFRTISTSVEQVPGLPTEFALRQNYPNPFNPSTTIAFSIPEQTHASLIVYDLLGREIEVLMNDVVSAGEYHVTFDASRWASGTYLYRLVAGTFAETKKMQVVK
ncbi:MAG: family 10 glycosylhydrolase [Ignavibacteriae bacterium]|nr:family 10 glycosylhydrolase [Ignavibacteriota bacterium]